MTSHPVIEQMVARLAWRAVADGEPIGRARLVIRPDRRCFAFFEDCRADAYEPLLAAITAEVSDDLHVTINEANESGLERLQQLGFVESRRESTFRVPTAPELTGFADAGLPEGVTLVPADRVDVDRLRLLDDALRADVPGTDGWTWDAAGFRDETFDPSYFDPATYLVAVDAASGGYVGLVRIWNPARGPRFGLVAVLPPYRHRGLARALLARVFAVLHARGHDTVTAQVDDSNAACRALGGRELATWRIGGTIELVRRGERRLA